MSLEIDELVKSYKILTSLAGGLIVDNNYILIDKEQELATFVLDKNASVYEKDGTTRILQKYLQDFRGTITVIGYAQDGLVFSDLKCKTLNLDKLDTSTLTSMKDMFSNLIIYELNISNFQTSHIKNIDNMFGNSKMVQLNISNFSFAGLDLFNSTVTNWFEDADIECLILNDIDFNTFMCANKKYNLADPFRRLFGDLYINKVYTNDDELIKLFEDYASYVDINL